MKIFFTSTMALGALFTFELNQPAQATTLSDNPNFHLARGHGGGAHSSGGSHSVGGGFGAVHGGGFHGDGGFTHHDGHFHDHHGRGDGFGDGDVDIGLGFGVIGTDVYEGDGEVDDGCWEDAYGNIICPDDNY